MANLFIPTKIRVGFQKRSDTFTGKLAYVIYYDEKGKIRKETSWEGWRDKKITALELDNIPRSGYLFNKGVQRDGYYWGGGRSTIRVYDPRDFEFEITVDNLIGILMHSDVSKRDIVEECVFAWEGKELVLLPVNSAEYQASVKYTQKLAEKVSARDLVKGYTYNQKRSEDVLIYIGYFDWYDWGYVSKHTRWSHKVHSCSGKKHVFYNEKTKQFVVPGIATLSSVNSEEVVENYASLVDKFYKTMNSQPIVAIKVTPHKKITDYTNLYQMDGDKINSYYIYRHDNKPFDNADNQISSYKVSFDKKETHVIQEERQGYSYGYYNRSLGPIAKHFLKKAEELGFDSAKINREQAVKILESENYGKLSYLLENGTVIPVNSIL